MLAKICFCLWSHICVGVVGQKLVFCDVAQFFVVTELHLHLAILNMCSKGEGIKTYTIDKLNSIGL